MTRFPVLTYFVLAYAISWLAALALHLIALQAGLENFNDLMRMAETTFSLGTITSDLILPVPIVFLLTRIVDFGPSLAGLLTPLIIGDPKGARDILRRLFNFRVGMRWYAWALLLPLGIVSAAFGLHMIFGDSVISGMEWDGLATFGQLIFWVFLMRTLLGGGLGEELGWRGFALPRLSERHGAFRASLIIGLVWTFWHLPGHLVSSNPLVNVVAQLLYTVPLSFVFTWLYYRSKESLLPVVLMHGALNGFNVFFERTLFPSLADEDSFVIFFILVVVVVGIISAATIQLRRIGPKI
jgi:membrane protease YdiL (CAAX protease family)